MNVLSGLEQGLSAAAARRIDHACDQFEEAWRSGRQPPLEDYLSANEEPERSVLLRELLSVELDQRRSRGLPPDDYVARFPNDRAVIETVLGRFSEFFPSAARPASSTFHDVAAPDTTSREPPRPSARWADANGAESGPRYHLLDELGQGAIGVVYRARDDRLGRDVAVKVLRESRAGDVELRRRFEREARIVGQLEHPGIVPVHDSGELAGGRPFFTMKLVQGQTLAALLRGRADPASEAPRFLKIFEQVCLAVAYAHARGIVHRDLKPSNVMVGALGEVQVMDWGFAKVLATPETDVHEPSPPAESAAGSQAGCLLGTPAYMAPEQARGEVDGVDRRADVFSLGAILCELLTGQPPYLGSDPAAALDQATRAELQLARSRLEASAADVELKSLACECLAAAPEHRPADAGAVAAALTAYLTSVQQRLQVAEQERAAAEARAAQAGATVRAERRARRFTLAFALTVVTLVVFAGGVVWRLQHERQAQAVEAARIEAQVQSALAEAEDFARRKQWSEALAAARRAQDLLQGRSTADLARRTGEVLADLKLVTELEEIRLEISDVDVESNRYAFPAALSKFARAFEQYGLPLSMAPQAAAELLQRRPESIREAVLTALDTWWQLALVESSAEREALGERVNALDSDDFRRQVRAEIVRGVRARLVELAARREVTELPPATLQLLAWALLKAGDINTAVSVLQAAQLRFPGDYWINHELARASLGLRPAKIDDAVRFFAAARALRPRSAVPCVNLGYALSRNGDWDGVIAVSRKAIELSPNYARAHNNLGSGLLQKGDFKGALEALEKSRSLFPHEPETHANLGLVLVRLGRPKDALAAIDKALELRPGMPQAYNNLGLARQALDDDPGAVAAFEKAIRLKSDWAWPYSNLASVLQKQNDFERAEVMLRTALAHEPKFAPAHDALGTIATRRKDWPAAIASFRRAAECDPRFGPAHYNLGMTLHAQGDLRGGLAALDKALQADGDTVFFNALGVSLSRLAHYDQAIRAFDRGLIMQPESPELHFNLANAWARKQQWSNALDALSEALRLKPEWGLAHCRMADALAEQGRFTEALEEYRRGLEPIVKNPQWRTLADQGSRRMELWLKLEADLPALVRGDFKPANADEDIEYARLSRCKGWYATSARCYAEAFRAKPALLTLGRPRHRYAAACVAALAGVGEGKDADSTSDDQRERLRAQALEWQRAELELWTKLARSKPPQSLASAAVMLTQFRNDPSFELLRRPEALARLPHAERAAWQQWWTDLDATLENLDRLPRPALEGGSRIGNADTASRASTVRAHCPLLSLGNAIKHAPPLQEQSSVRDRGRSVTVVAEVIRCQHGEFWPCLDDIALAGASQIDAAVGGRDRAGRGRYADGEEKGRKGRKGKKRGHSTFALAFDRRFG